MHALVVVSGSSNHCMENIGYSGAVTYVNLDGLRDQHLVAKISSKDEQGLLRLKAWSFFQYHGDGTGRRTVSV